MDDQRQNNTTRSNH